MVLNNARGRDRLLSSLGADAQVTSVNTDVSPVDYAGGHCLPGARPAHLQDGIERLFRHIESERVREPVQVLRRHFDDLPNGGRS